VSREPKTSVVVCTYNRAASLARLLDSLAAQTAPADAFEVVVVDDGSADGTRAVAFSRRGSFRRLEVVTTGRNAGLASASNLGARSAGGERLLYIDDDCIARPDWIAAMVRSLETHPIVAGAVASRRRDFLTLAHNVSSFHRFLPGQPPGPVDFLAGANFGFTRQVYDVVGGFEDGRRTASDMEFLLRARARGFTAWFAPDAVVVHAPRYVSFRSLFGYVHRHARVTIRLRERYANVLRTPFLLRSPRLLAAAAPAVALATTLGAYGRNRSLRGLLATAPIFFALRVTWCLGAAAGLREGQASRG
jgi:GT2 family glycosyltransferase